MTKLTLKMTFESVEVIITNTFASPAVSGIAALIVVPFRIRTLLPANLRRKNRDVVKLTNILQAVFPRFPFCQKITNTNVSTEKLTIGTATYFFRLRIL